MRDDLGELLAPTTDADRVTVNAARFRELRNAEKAVERVRAALEEDVWSDRDPHGQLQKYLDALRSNPS